MFCEMSRACEQALKLNQCYTHILVVIMFAVNDYSSIFCKTQFRDAAVQQKRIGSQSHYKLPFFNCMNDAAAILKNRKRALVLFSFRFVAYTSLNIVIADLM